MKDAYTLTTSATRHAPGGQDGFAWSVRVHLPWFRALPMSCVERVRLSAGDEAIAEADLLFRVGRRLVPLPALQAMTDRYWAVDEALQFGIGSGGPVPRAETVISIELTLRMPEGGREDWPRRTTRASVRLAGHGGSRWPLGVCTFSFGGVLRRGRSLRSCLDEAATLGYTAVELLGAQVVEGYPAPSPHSVDRLSGMLRDAGLAPLCYDGFIDPGRSGDRAVRDPDVLRWAETELAIAAVLGCTYVRLNVAPRRSLLESLAESAERHGLVILSELHAQTSHDASVQVLLGLLHELQCPQLGLIVDLSSVMQSLPPGFLRLLTDTGAAPEVARLIESSWRDGLPPEALEAELAERSAGDDVVMLAQRAYRLFRRSDPGWLPDVLAFTRIVHGKFYGIDGGREPAIAYREVLAALARAQFDGYLMSEYEGHLWDDSLDTFGQLLEHRRMIAGYADVQ